MNKCDWCEEGRYTLIGNKEMSTLYCMNLDKDDLILITGGFPNNTEVKTTNFMKIERI